MHHHHASAPSSDILERLQRALGSSYVIERELGGGGMSRIFLAREVALGRHVVVKLLPPEYAAGVNGERFHREILLAARLQHPHIVPILSAGEMNGVPYYTMPFIDGESLRSRLLRGGEFTVAEVKRILHDVIDALAYAHEHGVVHRDIKPDNILMSRQHALITDFGVAKALCAAHDEGCDSCDHLGGEAGFAIGTPAYMAPEQAAADPSTDHRADLYGFGILAYELLTGQPPFSGREPLELLAAHVAETPIPITALRPDVPAALADLVMGCLEKQPEHRPASASDIRDALEHPEMSIDFVSAPRESASLFTRVSRFATAAVVALLATGSTMLIGQRSSAVIAADSAGSERAGAPMLGSGLNDGQWVGRRRSIDLPPVAANEPSRPGKRDKLLAKAPAPKSTATKPTSGKTVTRSQGDVTVTLRSQHGVTVVAGSSAGNRLVGHAERLQTIEAMLGGGMTVAVAIDTVSVDRLGKQVEALVRSLPAPVATPASTTPRRQVPDGSAGSAASAPATPVAPARVISLVDGPRTGPAFPSSACAEEAARRAREEAARLRKTRATTTS